MSIYIENKETPQSMLAKSSKLKEIDELYREQLKKIYSDSKGKLDRKVGDYRVNQTQKDQSKDRKEGPKSSSTTENLMKKIMSPKSSTVFNMPESQHSSSKFINSTSEAEDKIRASMFLKGQSTRTMEILRRQNESKQLKIRQLSHKCQNLVQKLKKHLNDNEFQAEMETLKQFSDGKMERLEHLFKIKHEEIFFKIKLQVIGLLQEFGMSKQDLTEFNDVSSETNLFSMMTRKLKNKLKDFRSKEQESSFELQKDKIMNQKQQERIHYLTETNELMKLSETKLKSKVEDLKYQLNEYLERLRMRQRQNQQNQNDVFRLKKQNEDMHNINQRLNAAIKDSIRQKVEQKSLWEAKEKEMKTLLNNYFIQKKRLETELQEKQGEIEELVIKFKFLQQDNERISRELIRWKERYEGQQREHQVKFKEIEEQQSNFIAKFEIYKAQFNQGALYAQRSEADEAMRKIEEYQRSYERVVMELQDERRLLRRLEEDAQEALETQERQWLQRFKALQKIKEETLLQINQDCQTRARELRDEYEKKQQLLSEQMQARLRALLAQKDKKTTQQLIRLQTQNDELIREVSDLNKIVEVKESLINVINSKKV